MADLQCLVGKFPIYYVSQSLLPKKIKDVVLLISLILLSLPSYNDFSINLFDSDCFINFIFVC